MKLTIRDESSIFRMMWRYEPFDDSWHSWKWLDITSYGPQSVHNSRFWELFKVWCDNRGYEPTIERYVTWRIAQGYDDDTDPDHQSVGVPHLDPEDEATIQTIIEAVK